MTTRTSSVDNLNTNKKLIIALFFLLVSVCVVLLYLNNVQELFLTSLLLFTCSALGIVLVVNTSIELKDKNIIKLCYIYLLKVLTSILFLNFIWIPYLNDSLSLYGDTLYGAFDPVKYYFFAHIFEMNNFSLDALPNVNYQGVIYYYGIIFKIFGFNAIIPAIINNLLSLIASLCILRLGYIIKSERKRYDWVIGIIMIIPELAFYDSITSKESLCMIFFVFVIYNFVIINIKRNNIISRSIAIFFMIIFLGLVRTSILIALGLTMLTLSYIFGRSKGRNKKLGSKIMLIVIAVIILIIPIVTSKIGYEYNYSNVLSQSLVGDASNTVEGFGEGQSSFTQLMVPKNTVQRFVVVPMRFIINIIAPFPQLTMNIENLFKFIQADWQNFVTTISVVVYILFLPYIIIVFIDDILRKKRMNSIVFLVPLFFTLLTISAGVYIIHPRYRIFCIPYLWASIWLGFGRNKKLRGKCYGIWIMFIVLLGFVYFIYKQLF